MDSSISDFFNLVSLPSTSLPSVPSPSTPSLEPLTIHSATQNTTENHINTIPEHTDLNWPVVSTVNTTLTFSPPHPIKIETLIKNYDSCLQRDIIEEDP